MDKYTNEHIKWYTNTEFIDVDTGEIMTKSQYEKGNYRIIQKTKSVNIIENGNNKHGEIKWTYEVREHEQQQLQFK